MAAIPKDFRRSLTEIARSVKELYLPSQLTEVQVVARVTWMLDQAPDSLHRHTQGTGPRLFKAIKHVVPAGLELTQDSEGISGKQDG